MSDKIVNLIQLIDDIRCDIEKSKFKRDFGSMKLQEKLLQQAKNNLVDAVREEYKNDTKTRV
jgi:hypothetical protein